MEKQKSDVVNMWHGSMVISHSKVDEEEVLQSLSKYMGHEEVVQDDGDEEGVVHVSVVVDSQVSMLKQGMQVSVEELVGQLSVLLVVHDSQLSSHDSDDSDQEVQVGVKMLHSLVLVVHESVQELELSSTHAFKGTSQIKSPSSGLAMAMAAPG